MTNPTESLQPVLTFNGQDNAINLGKKPQFKIEKAITIEAWICVASQKEYAGIISNIYDTGLTESGYGLLLDGKSGIYFGLKVASAGIQYLSSGANTIILNQWHHIAGTYDGQEMKLYVDGIEKAKKAIAGTNINYNPENDLLFGMYKDNDEFYAFPGKLAEIRLWKITRTQPEIQNNRSQRLTGNEAGLVGYWPLNEGINNIAHDQTSNANHGVINRANWEQLQAPFTISSSTVFLNIPNPTESWQPILVFNGQDDAINLGKKPQFKIEKQITLEAWICVTAQKEYAGIISNIYDTGSTESGYGLLLDGKSGIYFGLKVASAGIQYLSSGANTIILNQWHHIVGTYDGQEMKLYVDGIEKAKKAIAGTNINYNPENDLLFGMYKDNDEFYAFPGKLAEIRLWKITRTQPEIQNNRSQRLTGNEAGLVGYWPLNEGINNIAHDQTSNANHGVINRANWEQFQVPFTTPISPEESSLPETPAAPSQKLKHLIISDESNLVETTTAESGELTDFILTEESSLPETPTPASQRLKHLIISDESNLVETTTAESGELSQPKIDNLKTTSWIELKPARHQVAIYGQISDAETGLTIQNALVEITEMPETFEQLLLLRSQKYGNQWETLENRPDRKRTAIDGFFHFLDLPEGEYTLTASLPSAGTCYGTAEVKAIVSRDSQGNYVKNAANMTLPPTAIKGQITDLSGSPIVLAKIQIAKTTNYIFSDNKGNYVFSGLETSKLPSKRTININVSARGFQSVSQNAELSQGTVQNLNFVLPSS